MRHHLVRALAGPCRYAPLHAALAA
jgi:hypothetical protein